MKLLSLIFFIIWLVIMIKTSLNIQKANVLMANLETYKQDKLNYDR